ncbi:MAG: biotin--[acetyl-CoA-carboxylase] ligase [Proteobacteria bacterium]|nr:biotin--[acetyl-CoA-carboxylase] ligase [Pseudomonadota bacterium]
MHATTFELLRLLSNADFQSGAALSRKLGVSPAALRLALQDLETLGLALVRVRGRGYRLAEPYDFLDAAGVNAGLGAHAPRFRLDLLDACASTSTLLLERAREGAPAGSVIACEWQSAGRGRRGNTWQSGLGGNLTFSLLWRFAQGAAGLSGLSLAVGVAVARGLESTGIAGVQLKWPNDLLHAGRKLGGILIEVHADSPGATATVIGIGINLRLPAVLRDAIAQAVTDVASISRRVPRRNEIIAATLAELAPALDLFSAQGFAPLREEWTARHAHQGKAVALSSGDGNAIAGRAVGVADDGALLLETARGVERFVSGELSLRAIDA